MELMIEQDPATYGDTLTYTLADAPEGGTILLRFDAYQLGRHVWNFSLDTHDPSAIVLSGGEWDGTEDAEAVVVAVHLTSNPGGHAEETLLAVSFPVYAA